MWMKTRRQYYIPRPLSNSPTTLQLCSFCLLVFITAIHCQFTRLKDIKSITNLTECGMIGFKEATACGYCTGKGSNLASDYDKDCKGTCGGKAEIDCNGDCEGQAYRDPCTNECIGGNTGITEDTIPKGIPRDCSGACFGSTPWRVNECNQCSIGGREYPFQDCNGDCYAPYQFETKRARVMCGKCVGGNSPTPISEVLDACGNCKTENKPCPCNGTQNEDICKLCGGKNDTCLAVERFEPLAVPAGVPVQITVFGAFRGKKKNVKCIFKLSDDDEDFSTSSKVNGNSLSCRPNLKKGDYKVGIYLTESDQATSNEKLLVYENNVNFTYMSPTSIAYNDPKQTVNIEFQGDNLPAAPIVFIVNGPDWPSELRVLRGRMYSCELPLPKASQNVVITPSFSETIYTKQSFIFTFFSPPVTFAQGTSMSEDKTAIIITFDRPVDVCDLDDCSAMLDNSTIRNLENDAKCEWATKQQLIIKRTKPIRENKFQVTFKPDVLKEDNQKVAKLKTSDLSINVDVKPQSTVDPSLVITGPEIVPECGTFSLKGHFSLPGEASVYRWTAWRSDKEHLNSALGGIVESTKSATLTLNAEQLDADMDYTFQLWASSASKSTEREKTHTLRRMSYKSPIVSVVSEPIPSIPMSTEQEIVLNAIITMPECFASEEISHIMWSIDNPRVKFNFDSVASPVYIIEANTIPADSIVTFTARAFIGSRVNESSESSITLRTAPLKLEAAIEGSAERTIGTENGVIELIGRTSTKARVVYQWHCEHQDMQPCFDYSAEANNPLLLTRQKQSSPSIKFHSSSLKAGRQLKFGLKVHSASDSSLQNKLSAVTITVINGSIPEVILKSVSSGGKYQSPNPGTGAYFVPAGASLTLHAIITSAKEKIKSVTWDIIGSTKPFTYSVVEDNTYLSLGEGYLTEHGVYRIEVKACDTYNSCGGITISLYATPRVSLCDLIMKPYTAFTQTEAIVTGCSIPQDRLPLTYQMVMQVGTDYAPFIEPQYTDSIKFIGPPTKGERIKLGVEVCDRLGECNIFEGDPVEVSEPQDKGKLLNSVEKTACDMNNGGNPLGALCLFFPFSVNNNTEFTKVQIEYMVSYMVRAISMLPFTGRQIAALYTCMQPLLQLEDATFKVKVMNAITKATERAVALKEPPKMSALNKAYDLTGNVMNSESADGKLIQAARTAQMALIKCIASTLAFGNNVQLGNGKKGSPYSVIYNKIVDQSPITVRSRSSAGNMVSSVSFSEEIKERFTKWNCQQDKVCNGAVISVSFYPTKDPYGANNDKQLSPVLDVQMRTPGSGKVVDVQNVEDGIRIRLSLTGNKSKEKDIIYECNYWDEEKGKWSKEGIKPIGVVSGVMQCWSSHLSSFTVLESANAMSTAAIAGIVVACLMAVFIVCIVVLFFVKKKQNQNIRVSTEALQEEK